MSLAECQDTIDSDEFMTWKVFGERFEPYGSEWQQTAQLSLLIALAWLKKKSGRWKFSDFLPLIEEEAAGKTTAEIEAALNLFFAGLE